MSFWSIFVWIIPSILILIGIFCILIDSKAMMIARHDMDFVNDSKNFTDLVISARKFYLGVSNIAGQTTTIILSIPGIIALHFLLGIVHLKMRQHFKFKKPIDKDNYLSYKDAQAVLNIIYKKIGVIERIPLSQIPLTQRLVFLQARYMVRTLNKYRRVLNNKLVALNPKQDSDYFTLVKESDLYKRRSKVYDFIA